MKLMVWHAVDAVQHGRAAVVVMAADLRRARLLAMECEAISLHSSFFSTLPDMKADVLVEQEQIWYYPLLVGPLPAAGRTAAG